MGFVADTTPTTAGKFVPDGGRKKKRMSKSDALWFAAKMGLSDTARGIGQLIPGDVGEEWLADKQSELNDLMDDEE